LSRPRSPPCKARARSRCTARNPRREQAVRVRLERRNGSTVALVNGAQGSHMMSSLLGADALALIPPGEGELAPGTTVALAGLPR
jgi:molybdopterin molybdotransferase